MALYWEHESLTPEVPNPRAMDQHRSVACKEPGRIAGAERWAREQSFICGSQSLPLPPELRLLSYQWRH